MVALTEAETELVKTMTVILSGDDGIRLPLATLQLFVVQFSPFFSKLNASESFLRMVLSDQVRKIKILFMRNYLRFKFRFGAPFRKQICQTWQYLTDLSWKSTEYAKR